MERQKNRRRRKTTGITFKERNPAVVEMAGAEHSANIAFLSATRRLAAVSLVNVTRLYSNHALLVENNVMSCIVSLLKASDRQLQHRGARALSCLCQSPNDHSNNVDEANQLYAESNGFAETKGKRHAAQCVIALIVDFCTREFATDHHLLPFLFCSSRLQGDKYLWIRGWIDAQIVAQGALKLLVSLASEHNILARTRMHVAKALHGLSMNIPTCRALVQERGLYALVHLAASAIGPEVVWSFSAAMESGGGVPHKAGGKRPRNKQSKGSSCAPILYHVTSAIANVATLLGESAHALLVKDGAILPLVALMANHAMHEGDVRVCQFALRAVCAVSESISHRLAIADAGAIRPLLMLTSTEDKEIRLLVARVIANLTVEAWLEDTQGRPQSLQSRTALGRVLSTGGAGDEQDVGDANVLVNAGSKKLVRSQEIRLRILEMDGITFLLNMCETTDPAASEVVHQAVRAIAGLAETKQFRHGSMGFSRRGGGEREGRLTKISLEQFRGKALSDMESDQDKSDGGGGGGGVRSSGNKSGSGGDSSDYKRLSAPPRPKLQRGGSLVGEDSRMEKVLLHLLESPNILARGQACRALAALTLPERVHKWPNCEHLRRTIIDVALPRLVEFLSEYLGGDLGAINAEMRNYAETILVNCGFEQGSADVSFCRNDPQLMRDWLHIEQCIEYQAFILEDAVRVALKLVWGKENAKGIPRLTSYDLSQKYEMTGDSFQDILFSLMNIEANELDIEDMAIDDVLEWREGHGFDRDAHRGGSRRGWRGGGGGAGGRGGGGGGGGRGKRRRGRRDEDLSMKEALRLSPSPSDSSMQSSFASVGGSVLTSDIVTGSGAAHPLVSAVDGAARL